jgi:hypothetical protein
VKSTHEAIAVLGERTEKIVDLFRTEWKHRGLLVKFKLEVGIGRDDLCRRRPGEPRRERRRLTWSPTRSTWSRAPGPARSCSDATAATKWVAPRRPARRLARLVRSELKL